VQAQTFDHIPTLERPQTLSTTRVVLETVLAVGFPLLITLLIGAFRLYPRIPNISIIYLVLILFLASSFGRYSSVLASIVAFLSFDYFLVPPLYTFTMDRWEEWIALGMFLVTALLTSQLTTIMRQRTAEALMRERELRILYELMRLTNSHTQLEQQLDDMAASMVHVFNAWGVIDAALLLPNPSSVLSQQASASIDGTPVALSVEEESLAIMSFHQKEMLEERTPPPPQEHDREHNILLYQSVGSVQLTRFIPLIANEQVLAVLFLRIQHPAPWFVSQARMEREREREHTRITFFWSFLEQMTSLLERSYLRSEVTHQS
jgi:hypothetical protein